MEFANRAVEAKEVTVFFDIAMDQEDWAQGLSLRVEKQMSRVKHG